MRPKNLQTLLLKPIPWPLRMENCHDGIPLGNGLFGALLWVRDGALRITVNRGDFWDHRGGFRFGPEATYANLKRWLREGNEEALRRAFEGVYDPTSGQPARPTRLPMGRVDLELPAAMRLVRASLSLSNGRASLTFRGPARLEVAAVMPRGRPLAALRFTGLEPGRLQPAAFLPQAPDIRDYFRKYGFPEAERFGDAGFGGWTQELPADPALGVAWQVKPVSAEALELFIAAVYGETKEAAIQKAREELQDGAQAGFDALASAEAAWWENYWRQAAQVSLPDREIARLYYLGMYKLAGLSMPGTPAATLQGPWIEEHRMPPWNGDYHFNINFQECYWPAYGGNHLEALLPAATMLQEWRPLLQENARAFLGIDDALMLPHAVDDRGTCMGGFWTGTLDNGSTAWTAQLFWLYYRYTLDENFLRQHAYPLLRGAMRVYEAMLEEEGGHYVLPFSVSPEFGGADLGACGRNASFQLAVIHFLCRALLRASEILGLDAEKRPQWQDIDSRLPLGSIGPSHELFIWDGQPLSESHRHHSHLAGIYPFDIFDPEDPEQQRLIAHSMRRLVQMGMGQWTGWCLPWASILFSRTGQGEMAALLLELYRRVFTRPCGASLHDARFPGFTVMARWDDLNQIEAALGAAAAVLEMLLHTRRGVLHVFPAVPKDWPDAAFSGIRAEGAFLVSAWRRHGATRWVRVFSEKGGTLRLANPFGEVPVRLRRPGQRQLLSPQAVWEIPLQPGEEVELRA